MQVLIQALLLCDIIPWQFVRSHFQLILSPLPGLVAVTSPLDKQLTRYRITNVCSAQHPPCLHNTGTPLGSIFRMFLHFEAVCQGSSLHTWQAFMLPSNCDPPCVQPKFSRSVTATFHLIWDLPIMCHDIEACLANHGCRSHRCMQVLTAFCMYRQLLLTAPMFHKQKLKRLTECCKASHTLSCHTMGCSFTLRVLAPHLAGSCCKTSMTSQLIGMATRYPHTSCHPAKVPFNAVAAECSFAFSGLDMAAV